MPEICRFYGIVIRMFYREHGVPHVHATYGGVTAVFSVDPISVLRGRLPPRARSFVVEWVGLHRAELLDNWARAEKNQALIKIAPLE